MQFNVFLIVSFLTYELPHTLEASLNLKIPFLFSFGTHIMRFCSYTPPHGQHKEAETF